MEEVGLFLPVFHFMLLLCIHFQLLQTWLLKTTQIYYLTDLEVRSPSCVKEITAVFHLLFEAYSFIQTYYYVFSFPEVIEAT